MTRAQAVVRWMVVPMVLVAATAAVHAAPLYYVDFNQAAGPAPATYVPAGVEVLPAGATMARRGTPTLEAAPAGTGREGGNAMRTVAGTGSASQGYAITGGPNLTGSWTAEAIIRHDSINPAGNVAGLQDIFNGETTNAANILRVDSSGQVHFYPMYNSGGGANASSRIASAGAIAPGQYWHVAAAWDQATEQAELFINGVSQGTLSRAGHSGPTFGGSFAVANNYNPAYAPRNIDGLTDALAITAEALDPSQFVYAHLPMAGYDFAGANGGGLFVQPAAGDLVAGMIPNSNVGLQGGTSWAALTDGLGTTGHPSMTTRTLGDDNATTPANPWQLTFPLRPGSQISEVRVFTQNPDCRVFQDYDVEVSADGVNWTMLASNVTNGIRGFSVNDWGDAAMGDWSAAAVRRLDALLIADNAAMVRFTLREVGQSGGSFAALNNSIYNSFLYEIDVLGQAGPAARQRTPIGGGFNNPQLGGGPGTVDGNPTTAGFIGTPFPPGAGTDDGGQFGATFDGPSLVSSLAITQDATRGSIRQRLQDITVHASGGRTYQFTLANQQDRQILTLPETVGTSYLLVTADSYYTVDGAGTPLTDPNPGIVEFEAFGQLVIADVNHNAGLLPVAVGGIGAPFNQPQVTTDGSIHSNANDWQSATFFARNGGRDSLTVTYPEEEVIRSIGIGWAQDSTPIGLRDMPRFVTFETDAGALDVQLDDLLQYGRYDLPEAISTTFARLLFPEGSDPDSWYLHNDANYGVTEFQSFRELARVPEPSPLVLLGLGAVALLCWRRRGARGSATKSG